LNCHRGTEPLRQTSLVTESQTGATKKKLQVVDSKGAIFAVPPPRVFWKKRLDLLDSKGVDFFGDAKEAARIWKQKGWRELQTGIV
jgi:hypothetical protein